MKKVGNYYIQDDDSFFQFQYDRGFPMDGSLHRNILNKIPDGGNALDIGAHVGIWSRQLTKKFDKVYAWEPVESSCECLRKNVPNLEIFPFAAASKQGWGFVEQDIEGNYGGYFLSDKGEKVIIKVIDDFDFRNITFIQMHIKGKEYDALLGCKKTIELNRPTIVYQAYEHQLIKFGHSVEDIERFLTGLGYTIENSQLFKDWEITYFIAKP